MPVFSLKPLAIWGGRASPAEMQHLKDNEELEGKFGAASMAAYSVGTP